MFDNEKLVENFKENMEIGDGWIFPWGDSYHTK